MIQVDVRDFSQNVDVINVEVNGRIKCSDLIEECKGMLGIEGNYAMKQNDVFIHSSEMIKDGENLLLSKGKE